MMSIQSIYLLMYTFVFFMLLFTFNYNDKI